MRRPLLLSGFMGVGKSTTGQELARVTARPFIDLDRAIEARLGLPIAEYFAREGEPAFRRVEREMLLETLAQGASSPEPPVVALGGGALLSRDVRLQALDKGVVVVLEADPADVQQRTGRSDARPLLRANDQDHLAQLMELRAQTYAEAHAHFTTSRRSIREVAEDVLKTWRAEPIAVAAGLASYSVEIGREFGPSRLVELAKAPVTALVTDDNVAKLHADDCTMALEHAGNKVAKIVIAAGEAHKNIASIEKIWIRLQEAGADRKTLCVGLGGGVVTDMTGFVAATWMRGVKWIAMPTTLLAMVDASVGGKTGVDLGMAKNAVGAFWQPIRVLCDVALEATEPERGYRSALAEVVKTALIGDPELFDVMENRTDAILSRDPELIEAMVRRSVRVKARIVSADERESGERALLNLGHTVGHALEAQAGFERLTHGEAVSLGLVAALKLGVRRGVTPAALANRVTALLAKLKLPTDLSREPLGDAARIVGHDKKRAGSSLKFVFARELGQVMTESIGLEELVRQVSEIA